MPVLNIAVARQGRKNVAFQMAVQFGLLSHCGYLEIAVRDGSAAELIVPGDSETVWVTLSPPA